MCVEMDNCTKSDRFGGHFPPGATSPAVGGRSSAIVTRSVVGEVANVRIEIDARLIYRLSVMLVFTYLVSTGHGGWATGLAAVAASLHSRQKKK